MPPSQSGRLQVAVRGVAGVVKSGQPSASLAKHVVTEVGRLSFRIEVQGRVAECAERTVASVTDVRNLRRRIVPIASSERDRTEADGGRSRHDETDKQTLHTYSPSRQTSDADLPIQTQVRYLPRVTLMLWSLL